MKIAVLLLKYIDSSHRKLKSKGLTHSFWYIPRCQTMDLE